MTASPAYSFRLDDGELARQRQMAESAIRHEAELWAAAGIRPGAHVVDLGCGPGTFLPALAAAVGPAGHVTGVDRSPEAIERASAVRAELGLGEVDVVGAACDATGLDPGAVDTVFLRNVLVHNGPDLEAILDHVRSLLRPDGHLFSVEPDLAGLTLSADAPDEEELEQRWRDWMVAVGNDPSLGRHLSATIASCRYTVEHRTERTDDLRVLRSPAWTARHHLVTAGMATDAELERWGAAIDRRCGAGVLLEARLTMGMVVARPS